MGKWCARRCASIIEAAGSTRTLSAGAATLEFPVRPPGMTAVQVPAPAYVGGVIEVQLAPAAARQARAARTSDGGAIGPLRALGVPALDDLARRIGGARHELVFPQENLAGQGPLSELVPTTDFGAFHRVILPPGVSLERALDLNRARPEVTAAHPIAVLPLDLVPNDSLWTSSHWFDQPAGPDISAPLAWDVTTGDTGIVVAIIDTGILPYHPDLGGTTGGTGQIWINAREANGVAGVDDDGNGYVDDLRGWDFVALANPTDVRAGEDWSDADADPNDFVGPGTAVAGVIGALSNNTIGVTGTAWSVRLMGLRIGWAYPGSPPGSGEVRMDYAAEAIRYATRKGAHVINCSFSTAFLPSLDAAARAAVRAGVTLVSSAGNDNSPHYLADRIDVIAVAATDPGDALWFSSNRGAFVDLSAPGVGFTSTFVTNAGPDSIGYREPSYRGNLSGTSFSAPLVAGTVALLQALEKQSGRDPISPYTARLRLQESADDISAQNPFTPGVYGAGRLNAHRTLLDIDGSVATWIPSRSSGPSAVLDASSGVQQIAVPTQSGTVLILDPARLDTLMSISIGDVITTGVAASDLGPGLGLGLFFGTQDLVHGFRITTDIVPITGWPAGGVDLFVTAGPALGDINGDGVLDIVAGSMNGQVFAWHADGSTVTGFPASLGGGATGAIQNLALSDLHPSPGVEIVAQTIDGYVVALRGTGARVPGWPSLLYGAATAPLVMSLGTSGTPSVVIADGDQLHALTGAGVERPGFPATLSGQAGGSHLAAGDLDADGSDEILVVTQAGVEARDSSGVLLPGWPRPLPFSLQTATPVLGSVVPPASLPEFILRGGSSILVLGPAGDSLAFRSIAFNGSWAPSLAYRDGDSRREIVADIDPDSVFTILDVGLAGGVGVEPWPTHRGNNARTGSRLYVPGQAMIDDSPPLTVADFRVDSVAVDAARLEWMTPADVGPAGVVSFELRRATFPLHDGNFLLGKPLTGLPAPGPTGTAHSYLAAGLQESAGYWFAIRSRDAVGHLSLVAVASCTTSSMRPARVSDVQVIATTDSSVTLRWTATGDDSLTGRVDRYTVAASPDTLEADNFDLAPLMRVAPAAADPGDPQTFHFGGLSKLTHYSFGLKAVDDGGNLSALSNVVHAETGAGGPLTGRVGPAVVPVTNPTALPVRFYWQGAAGAARQEIRLFDLQGRLVRKIELGSGAGSGVVQWDGLDGDGRSLPAGLYFVRLISDRATAETRVALVR